MGLSSGRLSAWTGPDTATIPTGGTRMSEEALQPFALNYELIGPMQRVVAKLNFEGKLQAVSEDPAVHTQRLNFGDWTAVVSYGMPQFGNWMQPKGNDPADGGAMVAQLGPDEFLVTGSSRAGRL